MKIIFAANTLYDQLKTVLREKGVLIEIPETNHLYDGIRNHADLHVHPMGDRLYISKEVEGSIGADLAKAAIPYLVMQQTLGNDYPGTVLLNAVSTARYFIHNLDHSATQLLEAAEYRHLKRLHINQGYTRCTLLPLTDDTFITADRGVYNTLTSTDLYSEDPIEVHLIENGSVGLPGHPNGFFPGACGVLSDTLYINGDLDLHPDSDQIRLLCLQLGLNISDVPGKPLMDIGSILHFKA